MPKGSGPEPVFATSRLTVRRWHQGDLSPLLEVYGDKDAMRWVGDGSSITEDECVEWLDVTLRNYQQRGYGMFAVEALHELGVVGFVGLVHPGGQVEPELKYAFSRRYWGMGYATEAASGLLHWAESLQGIDFVIATTAPENIPSHNVLRKVGFAKGELRHEEDGSLTQIFEWRTKPDG